jgi:hypothetical protein
LVFGGLTVFMLAGACADANGIQISRHCAPDPETWSAADCSHFSYDGSTVAFGVIPKRRLQDLDLFILNVGTGEVRPTRLLEKLAEHPEFNLP